jgi:FKBP-type peptidyl-prolyl cis-trans isomerase
MLFNSFFGKPKDRPPQPSWVKWILGICLLYALLQGLTKDRIPGDMTPVQQSMDQAEKSLASTLDFSDYKNKIFPDYKAKILSRDITAGKGNAALCGQTLSIAYEAYREDGSAIKDSASKAKPYRFQWGAGKAMPVFEKGLTDMRVGGKRRIVVPMSMSYGAKGFERTDLPSNAQISFDVELTDVRPAINDDAFKAYRIAEIRSRYGAPLECGKEAHINLIIWDVEGNQLYSTNYPAPDKPENKANTAEKPTTPEVKQPEGLRFIIGASDVFLGLEQGVIGMTPGSVRTLIVPPSLQKTLNGTTPAFDFPLPKQQTILVDVEYLP